MSNPETEPFRDGCQKRSHIDNHYLDAEVYALAAADISGVRTLHLQDEAEAKAKAERPEEAYAPEENMDQAKRELDIGGNDMSEEKQRARR